MTIRGKRVVVSAPGPLEGELGTVQGQLGQVGAVWDEWCWVKLDSGGTVKMRPWLVKEWAGV